MKISYFFFILLNLIFSQSFGQFGKPQNRERKFECQVLFSTDSQTSEGLDGSTQPTSSAPENRSSEGSLSEGASSWGSSSESVDQVASEDQVQKLYESFFSKHIKKSFDLTWVKKRLSNSPAHQRLWGEWIEARRNFEIFSRNTHPNDEYTKKLKAAAQSALDKHFPIQFTRLGEGSEQDSSRYLEILKAIQSFDSENPKVSSFRLQRLIAGRYDLDQFIACR